MMSSSPASQFITLWQSGKCDTKADQELEEILSNCPLSGRMIHGKTGVQGFGELLSSDRWKRLSWVFGPEALTSFLGKSTRDICLILGFGEEWLDAKLEKGDEFKLAIFPSLGAAEVKQATWDGVAHLLKSQYEEVWESKIERHWEKIKTTSFDEIQQLAGYNMLQVNLVGRDHDTGESTDDRYMSLQRLVKREGNIIEVRQFLWDEIGLKGIFSGEGYTMDDKGVRGPQEYLARNISLKDIEGIEVIDVIPHKEQSKRDICWEDSCCVS